MGISYLTCLAAHHHHYHASNGWIAGAILICLLIACALGWKDKGQ